MGIIKMINIPSASISIKPQKALRYILLTTEEMETPEGEMTCMKSCRR